MKNILTGLFGVLACAALIGCGGLDYDADYDCKQTIDCMVERTGMAQGTVSQCVAATEALLDGLTPAQEAKLEEVYAACKSMTACEYADCATANALTDANATPVGVAASFSAAPTRR